MDANSKTTLSYRLKEELKRRKVSVPEFEAQTGIPKDRVYKWLKRGTDKMGHEDADKINQWMKEKMDNVPHETPPVERVEDHTPIMQVIINLSYAGKKNAESMDKMAESNLINTRSIATLINILANSGLTDLSASLQNQQHTDSNLPAEAFLGEKGADVIRRQQHQTVNKPVKKGT